MGNQRDALYARQLRDRPLAPKPNAYRRGVAHGAKLIVAAVHAALRPEDLDRLNRWQNHVLEPWSEAPVSRDDEPPPKPPRLSGEGV